MLSALVTATRVKLTRWILTREKRNIWWQNGLKPSENLFSVDDLMAQPHILREGETGWGLKPPSHPLAEQALIYSSSLPNTQTRTSPKVWLWFLGARWRATGRTWRRLFDARRSSGAWDEAAAVERGHCLQFSPCMEPLQHQSADDIITTVCLCAALPREWLKPWLKQRPCCEFHHTRF